MAHLRFATPGALHFLNSLRPLAVAAVAATALAFFAAAPARSTVIVDIHYQGLDEIELADLPADGRLTLDVDIHWDGAPAGLVGLGFGVLFDPTSAGFVGGTQLLTTLFANPYGGDGFYMTGPPEILANRFPAGSSTRRIWPSNLVSGMGGIRLPSATDYPGSEYAAYQLTFDVRDVSTFEVLLGVGDAVLFYPAGGPYTTCLVEGTPPIGDVSYTGSQCAAAGMIEFDGFKVVDGERVGATPTPIFDLPHAPEPGASLLIGLGLAGLAGGRRRGE